MMYTSSSSIHQNYHAREMNEFSDVSERPEQAHVPLVQGFSGSLQNLRRPHSQTHHTQLFPFSSCIHPTAQDQNTIWALGRDLVPSVEIRRRKSSMNWFHRLLLQNTQPGRNDMHVTSSIFERLEDRSIRKKKNQRANSYKGSLRMFSFRTRSKDRTKRHARRPRFFGLEYQCLQQKGSQQDTSFRVIQPFLHENRTRRHGTYLEVFLNDFSVGVMRSEELHVGGLTDVSDSKAEERSRRHAPTGLQIFRGEMG